MGVLATRRSAGGGGGGVELRALVCLCGVVALLLCMRLFGGTSYDGAADVAGGGALRLATNSGMGEDGGSKDTATSSSSSSSTLRPTSSLVATTLTATELRSLTRLNTAIAKWPHPHTPCPPAGDNDVFLYAHIDVDTDHELLPYFLQHYLELGVTPQHVLLVLNTHATHMPSSASSSSSSSSSPSSSSLPATSSRRVATGLREAQRHMRRFGITPFFTTHGPHSIDTRRRIRDQVVQDVLCFNNTWLLTPHVDELFELDYDGYALSEEQLATLRPALRTRPLNRYLLALHCNGISAVRGVVYTHTTRDCQLREPRPLHIARALEHVHTATATAATAYTQSLARAKEKEAKTAATASVRAANPGEKTVPSWLVGGGGVSSSYAYHSLARQYPRSHLADGGAHNSDNTRVVVWPTFISSDARNLGLDFWVQEWARYDTRYARVHKFSHTPPALRRLERAVRENAEAFYSSNIMQARHRLTQQLNAMRSGSLCRPALTTDGDDALAQLVERP